MGQYEILQYLLEENDWKTTRQVSDAIKSCTSLVGKGLAKLYKFGLIHRRDSIIPPYNNHAYQYKCREQNEIRVR